MDNSINTSQDHKNSKIYDGDDIIETGVEEFVISEKDDFQKGLFDKNVEKYKSSLNMRERKIYDNIIYYSIIKSFML